MSIEATTWQPPDGSPALAAIVLQNQTARMVVVPERGGKIVSLYDLRSREEWLWLNEELPWRPPSPADNYVKLHDLGGWDECFPTVAPAMVNGRSWPDHGDLWWRAWKSRVRGDALWMGVEGEGYRFERSMRPTKAGFLLNYAVENLGEEPLPYLWSAHPLFLTDPPLTVEVLGRPELRLANDSVLGKAGEKARWPVVKERDLEQIGKPSGLAAKLFLAMEEGEVILTTRDGAQLQMRWPVDKVPMLGLWVNEGGWSGTGGSPYCNLGVEPTSGAPDDLAVALNKWKCVQTLPPGEAQSWWLELKFIAGG